MIECAPVIMTCLPFSLRLVVSLQKMDRVLAEIGRPT
jgi:hypothetical protein